MNQGNKFCKNCGCPLKVEDKFCKNCGRAVSEQVVNNNPLPINNPNYYQNNIPPKNNGTGKYIIIAIILAIIVGVGVYFLISDKGEPSEPSGNNSIKL